MHVIYDELYSLTRWKAKLHLKRICGAQGHLIRSALYDILRIFHENPWKKCPWKKPDVFGLLVQDKFEKKGWKNWKKAHGNIAKNSMDLSMVVLYIFPCFHIQCWQTTQRNWSGKLIGTSGLGELQMYRNSDKLTHLRHYKTGLIKVVVW